jgi:hypothetical protein
MNKWIKTILTVFSVMILALSLASCKSASEPAAADADLAYWDGFDFGPNLAYAEEYASQSDSGEYMNAAEAAKLTFDDVRDTGHIPGYSDSVEYTMTLVDIADIDGDECYVYRCDGEDGFAAGFAYAYQIGDIYMQGQGGQWVPIIWGDGGYDG